MQRHRGKTSHPKYSTVLRLLSTCLSCSVPLIFQNCHLWSKWLCETETPSIFSRSFFYLKPYSETWVIGPHNILIKTLSDWLRTAETGLVHQGESLSWMTTNWEAVCSLQLNREKLQKSRWFGATGWKKPLQHWRIRLRVHHQNTLESTTKHRASKKPTNRACQAASHPNHQNDAHSRPGKTLKKGHIFPCKCIISENMTKTSNTAINQIDF